MSEQTICYSCGGRTYEHGDRCELLDAVATAIDDYTYEASRRNRFAGSRVVASDILTILRERGIVVHENNGECYVGDKLLTAARA